MKHIPYAILLSLVISGCGGGGSSTPAANVSQSSPTQVVPNSLVSAVAPATYTNDQAAAYNRLNAERSLCGFGLLAQNSNLDQSAAAHSLYEITNNSGEAHNETPGRPYFTGATPQARATAAGYSGTASEGMWIGDSGDDAMRGMISGPYHGLGMLNIFRDVGISYRLWTFAIPNGTASTNTLVVNLGYQNGAGPQQLGSEDVATYPCQGVTGVRRLLMGESPSPTGPSRNIGTNPVGTPLLVVVRSGQTLGLTSATLTKVGGGQVPLLPPVTMSNDPNHLLAPNTGFFLPDVPLDPDSDYQATINGTNNGKVFSRTFTFRTGRFCPLAFPCR